MRTGMRSKVSWPPRRQQRRCARMPPKWRRQLDLDISDITEVEMLAQFGHGLKAKVALHVAPSNPSTFEHRDLGHCC
jgi:hypothetical protein